MFICVSVFACHTLGIIVFEVLLPLSFKNIAYVQLWTKLYLWICVYVYLYFRQLGVFLSSSYLFKSIAHAMGMYATLTETVFVYLCICTNTQTVGFHAMLFDMCIFVFVYLYLHVRQLETSPYSLS